MRRNKMHELKIARLKHALQKKPGMSWGEMVSMTARQEYPNGARVLFYMSERAQAVDIPKIGIINEFKGHTPDGREIYDVEVDGTDTSLQHAIYIVEVLKNEKEI